MLYTMSCALSAAVAGEAVAVLAVAVLAVAVLAVAVLAVDPAQPVTTSAPAR
jgi:hypothetical protein